MSKLTTSKQGDILNTQNNTEETPKQNSLVEREPIEGTPFWIIGQEGKHFITFAEYRVSEIKESKTLALAELQNNDWNIIMHMAAVIVEKTLKERGLVKEIMENKS